MDKSKGVGFKGLRAQGFKVGSRQWGNLLLQGSTFESSHLKSYISAHFDAP